VKARTFFDCLPEKLSEIDVKQQAYDTCVPLSQFLSRGVNAPKTLLDALNFSADGGVEITLHGHTQVLPADFTDRSGGKSSAGVHLLENAVINALKKHPSLPTPKGIEALEGISNKHAAKANIFNIDTYVPFSDDELLFTVSKPKILDLKYIYMMKS
jgi:hypothetical protein